MKLSDMRKKREIIEDIYRLYRCEPSRLPYALSFKRMMQVRRNDLLLMEYALRVLKYDLEGR